MPLTSQEKPTFNLQPPVNRASERNERKSETTRIRLEDYSAASNTLPALRDPISVFAVTDTLPSIQAQETIRYNGVDVRKNSPIQSQQQVKTSISLQQDSLAPRPVQSKQLPSFQNLNSSARKESTRSDLAAEATSFQPRDLRKQTPPPSVALAPAPNAVSTQRIQLVNQSNLSPTPTNNTIPFASETPQIPFPEARLPAPPLKLSVHPSGSIRDTTPPSPLRVQPQQGTLTEYRVDRVSQQNRASEVRNDRASEVRNDRTSEVRKISLNIDSAPKSPVSRHPNNLEQVENLFFANHDSSPKNIKKLSHNSDLRVTYRTS